jgi:hypothetical protein
MSGAVFYDLILSPGPSGGPGDVLSVAGGQLVSVEEPVKVSLQDWSGTFVQLGDLMHLPAGDVKIIGINVFAAEIVFDFGNQSQTVKLAALEVTDGTDTFTLYVPIDKQGDFPGIVEITLLKGDIGLKALPVELFDDDDDVTLICYAAGTPIRTARGWCPIERLRPGDAVWTLDDGPQPLRWVGARRVAALGRLAPVTIAPGTFGNRGALVVSPQHRMLVAGPCSDLMFGEPEVLVPACRLVDGRAIRRRAGGAVTYVHLLFDRHQVIDADGALSESLWLGPVAGRALTAEQRAEVAALFPDLLRPFPAQGGAATARRVLKGWEAAALAATPRNAGPRRRPTRPAARPPYTAGEASCPSASVGAR